MLHIFLEMTLDLAASTNPFLEAALDRAVSINLFVETATYGATSKDRGNRLYKRISRDNLFWEPFVETDVDWAASIRKGGVSTNQICSCGCLHLDQPPPHGP